MRKRYKDGGEGEKTSRFIERGGTWAQARIRCREKGERLRECLDV